MRAYALAAAGVLLGVGVVALLVARKGGVAGAAQAAGGAAVAAVEGVTVGAVEGIGQVVGVPRTNESECDRAIADGRMWDASFACPASRFVGAAWNKVTGSGPVVASYDETERLLKRYPAPADVPAATVGGEWFLPGAWSLGVAP